MYCILEILTTSGNQGVGRTYGPMNDVESAMDAAEDLAALAHKDHQKSTIVELNEGEIDGDDDFQGGYAVEDANGELNAIYLIKSLLTVAIPESP